MTLTSGLVGRPLRHDAMTSSCRSTSRGGRRVDPRARRPERSRQVHRGRRFAGLLPLTEGTIELDGDTSRTCPPNDARSGVCFQSDLLFPRLSALENVAFPLRARGTGEGRRARPSRANCSSASRPAIEPDREARAALGRVNGSASRWLERSSANRSCCSWTNRSRTWTCRAVPRSERCCATIARRFDRRDRAGGPRPDGCADPGRSRRRARSRAGDPARAHPTRSGERHAAPTRPTWSA